VSGALEQARAALGGEPVWVVGGAVRDRLLGRPTDDVDMVVAGDMGELARGLAAAAGGVAFALSATFGAWRVIGPGRSWQADLMPLEGATIEEDLGRRDFTINALAEPLGGGELVDPFGGRADLEARRLRMLSERALADDPLRVVRLARLAVELELDVDPATAEAAGRLAGRVAEVPGERVFAELRRIIAAPAPQLGIALLAGLGVLDAVLPEVAAQRGVEQSRYHHLDVYEHTLEVLTQVVALERDPEPALGEHAPATLAVLAEPLADELTRGQALRLGALLHDVAKPCTRGETAEGRVTFIGHDERGAQLAHGALQRLRASERLASHVAALTRHHLRAGFLVDQRPLSRRAIHAYLRQCEPVEVDVTVLSVADRLATRGHRSEEAIAAHLEVARELLGEALRWRAQGPPAPLLRGDELAAELAIERGPRLGRLLAELEAAQFAREVQDRASALRLARSLLARDPRPAE
jgi:poly(A) polymerase